MTRPRRLLFVCTGNTCRSPMAEHLFRTCMPADQGWIAESAGLFAAPGGPISTGAHEALRERGIDATSHRSRPLTSALVDRADLIVVMTGTHEDDVRQRFPAAAPRVRRLASFGTGKKDRDISDPIGLPAAGYTRSCDEIGHAVSDLVLYLVRREAKPRGTGEKTE